MATAEKNKLLLSIRSHKGHLTTRITVAENAITIARRQQPIASYTTDDLLRCKKKLNETFDALETKYNQLIALEEDQATQAAYTQDLTNETTRYNNIITTISSTLNQSAVRAPVESRPAERMAKMEVNKTLTPQTLNKDDSPVRLANWIRAFTQWYTASKMNLSTIPEQQAYFRCCLDPYLESRLDEKINDRTPIFSGEEDVAETSCIRLLQKEFLIRYPIVTRQYQFFSLTQQQGQQFSDWGQPAEEDGG